MNTSDITPQSLLERWHKQQTGFIKYRTLKIEMMATVVSHVGGEAPKVLDLACGPGALTDFILKQNPNAEIIAVDKDPLLLAIASDVYRNDNRVTVLEVDLDHRNWVDTVTSFCNRPFDAVVSATALHWLEPHILTNVYIDLYHLVRDGGIVMNSDSLYHHQSYKPMMRALSDKLEREHEENSFGIIADSWDHWFALAESYPDYADAVEHRKQVWPQEKRQFPNATLGFHLEALRSAGFREVDTIWQYFNDTTVYAFR